MLADLPVAVPIDGTPLNAELVDCNGKWNLTFETATGRLAMGAGDLVYWGTCREFRRGTIVFFDDGGMLAADVLSIKNRKIKVDSPIFGESELPLRRVVGFAFDLPTDRQRHDWPRNKIADVGDSAGCVMLSNGDQVAGVIESVENGSIRLMTDVGLIDLDLNRVEEVLFNRGLIGSTSLEGLSAWVGTSDGSLLIASAVNVDAKSFELEVLGGVRLVGSRKWLTFLQPVGGRALYLSDLKPHDYQFVPYLDLKWPYQVDANVEGGRLRCDNRLYVKGLGFCSDARIKYLLSESYRRFQAEFGIDDSTLSRGSVRARIYVDGQLRHTTRVVRGGDAPVSIDVDVSGGRRIELTIDYADRANVLDRANLLNARLVR